MPATRTNSSRRTAHPPSPPISRTSSHGSRAMGAPSSTVVPELDVFPPDIELKECPRFPPYMKCESRPRFDINKRETWTFGKEEPQVIDAELWRGPASTRSPALARELARMSMKVYGAHPIANDSSVKYTNLNFVEPDKRDKIKIRWWAGQEQDYFFDIVDTDTRDVINLSYTDIPSLKDITIEVRFADDWVMIRSQEWAVHNARRIGVLDAKTNHRYLVQLGSCVRFCKKGEVLMLANAPRDTTQVVKEPTD